jgi:exosortase
MWVFWPTLAVMADRWGNDPRYSHGYLVPLFSLYLLWSRRQILNEADCGPSWLGVILVLAGFLVRWAGIYFYCGYLLFSSYLLWSRRDINDAEGHPSWLGLPLLLAGLILRFAGTYFYYEWLAAIALLPCLAGCSLLIGGWAALRWSWTAIAFLVFMAPLPFRFEIALAHPLQRFATIVSTYALQTLGFVAIAEGNTIRIGDVRLGVAEACSGLSMLVIFFSLSTAVAMVIRRPFYEKALIFLSAIPIALVVNVTRIVATGVLKIMVSEEVGDRVFHDLAGWLMMPLALAIMWLELRILSWLVKDAPAREHQIFHPILGRMSVPSIETSRPR